MLACLLIGLSGCTAETSAAGTITIEGSQSASPTVPAFKTPGATPTATPLPTISPSSPILGGSWQAFDNLFGASNCCYENGWNYQGPFGATFTGVDDNGNNPHNQPDDSKSRITYIDTSPQESPETTWTSSQTQTMQAQFMPPDAQLKSTKQIYDVTNYVQVSSTPTPARYWRVRSQQRTSGRKVVQFNPACSTCIGLGTKRQRKRICMLGAR